MSSRLSRILVNMITRLVTRDCFNWFAWRVELSSGEQKIRLSLIGLFFLSWIKEGRRRK